MKELDALELKHREEEIESLRESELDNSAIQRACDSYERRQFFREVKAAQKKVFQK